MIGHVRRLPQRFRSISSVPRRGGFLNRAAASSLFDISHRPLSSGPPHDSENHATDDKKVTKSHPNDASSSFTAQSQPSTRDSQHKIKLWTMTEAKDKQLTGSVLLDFVKACNAAGIDFDETQQRVGEFMKNSDQNFSQSRSKRAFLFVLKAWRDLATTRPQVAGKEAERLLYQMLTLYLDEQNLDVKPCRECFSLVLGTHHFCGNHTATDRVLQDMLDLYNNTQDDDFRPDKQCFSWVLLSLFHNNKPSSDNRKTVYVADNILNQMIALAVTTNDSSLRPPESVLRHVLTLWTQNFSDDAGLRAEALLLRMQELPGIADSGDDELPSWKLFELVMLCWANSSAPKAAARVEQIREFVLENYVGDGTLPPSFGYPILLKAHSRLCWERPQESIENVDLYFQQLQKQFHLEHVTSNDIMTAYRAKLHAYGCHKDALKGGRECQAALEELLLLRTKGVINCDVGLSAVYKAVAYAWARIGSVGRVRELMERMKTDLPNEYPDVAMHNHLLLALFRSRDPTAGQQAEEIFFEMQKMGQGDHPKAKPNIHTYGTLMACLSRSPNPETASRATIYLEKLKELYKITGDEDLKPNAKIYTSAIRSLVKSTNEDAMERAQALLNEMNVLAHQGDETVKPDKITYAAVLKVLRVANVPNKAQRAEEILSQMKQNGIRPDSFLRKEMKRLFKVTGSA